MAPAAFLAVSTNPAIDRIARIEGPARGVVRAERLLETPGGKAIHAAAVAAELGCPTAVAVTAGGPSGELLLRLLEQQPVDVLPVSVDSRTRGTYTIVGDEGDLIEVHEPSGELTAEEAERLVAAVATATGSRVVAACGSLPPGAPVDLHARLIAAARELGAYTIVDCSTPAALEAALAEGPDLATPNRAEAIALLGEDAADAEPEQLAAAVRARGAGAAWISLGAEGSLLDDGKTVLRLRARPAAPAVNAVGCGDALVGGFAAGLVAGRSLADAAALGTAAATDKLTHLDSGRVERAAVEALLPLVEVEAANGAPL